MKRITLALLLGVISLYGGGKGVSLSSSMVMPIAVEKVNPWYIGVGTGYAFYDTSCYEDYTYGFLVRAGYEFNSYIGMEARAMRTFWKEGKNGGERAQHYGLFLKPMYPLTKSINVYGLAGYGWNGSINSGGNGNLPEIEGWSFSGGIGFEYDLSNKDDFEKEIKYDRIFDGYADQEQGWGFFIDYQLFWNDHYFTNQVLHKSSTLDLDSVFIGITYDF